MAKNNIKTCSQIILFVTVLLSNSIVIGSEKCELDVVVRKGDTLSGICRRVLGKYDETILRQIQDLNPRIRNPNLVRIGDVICLQALKPREQTEGSELTQKNPEGTEPADKPSKPAEATNSQPDEKIPDFVNVAVYPPPMPGTISKLTWLNDNTAIVEGRVESDERSVFYVYVPGDLEYEQPELVKPTPGTFRAKAIIGRRGRDYDQTFVLKLVLFDSDGKRISEIRRTLVRQHHEANQVVLFEEAEKTRKTKGPQGWKGIETWLSVQELSSMKSDNADFRIPNGRLVVNYRYQGYNPDERYLSRYGRVTLYGSSCLAKALLLKGDVAGAEEILRPWVAQIAPDGKVPRSANVIGDNYISPDVRTGEVAHFLGAMAMAQKFAESSEWDEPIRTIVSQYLVPLTDPETGLVRGGYNGIGSEGYGKPSSYSMLHWCSAEHNFDLFQALTFLAKFCPDESFSSVCHDMAWKIGGGIDQYLWDEEIGTFNRGWRPEGPDRARALDCSSWGALYLLKQAMLATEQFDEYLARHYEKMARRCLAYAENNFRTHWYYKTPGGKHGNIMGFRPYDGKIDDLRHEEDAYSGKIIDWDSLNDMVWSEGTLGVATAWGVLARQTGDKLAFERYRDIYRQMLKLQELSDKGGLLYSTRQIKGHFTMGEELASIGWLGYLSAIEDPSLSKQSDPLIRWMAW